MKNKKLLFVIFIFFTSSLYSESMKKMRLGERNFFGISKKYFVGLAVPVGCAYELKRRRFYRYPIIELVRGNHYLINISIFRQSHNTGAKAMKKAYDLLYRYGEQDSSEAGKKMFNIKKIKGTYGEGYYYLIECNLPHPFCQFKYVSRAVYVVKELRFFVILLYHKNDKSILEKTLDMMRTIQIGTAD